MSWALLSQTLLSLTIRRGYGEAGRAHVALPSACSTVPPTILVAHAGARGIVVTFLAVAKIFFMLNRRTSTPILGHTFRTTGRPAANRPQSLEEFVLHATWRDYFSSLQDANDTPRSYPRPWLSAPLDAMRLTDVFMFGSQWAGKAARLWMKLYA
ncbi:uncharacterized protein B0H18DRAFT_459423 [Fomitopsis serialis]|uniref:uncharacterized protein n=1 Tax=Fomitopsis serialis TaxID=139415 RepID=UPI0020078D90|nr:uncharacterized protein B0H18DRAFT_459423 [Neoantrodia serialis]KAH9923675.1 hypothetical protein B0H18DRAFT_459423 [Neoantrodia serialis]